VSRLAVPGGIGADSAQMMKRECFSISTGTVSGRSVRMPS
jgi:hypothetical protein